MESVFISELFSKGFSELTTFDASDHIETFGFGPNKTASASFIKLSKINDNSSTPIQSKTKQSPDLHEIGSRKNKTCSTIVELFEPF